MAIYTHHVMALFVNDEIRTFEEIQEWMRPVIRPEAAYRAQMRKQKNAEAYSQEEFVRRGVHTMTGDVVYYLVREQEWLEEADNKLEGKRIEGDLTFRLTDKGRSLLQGRDRSRAGINIRTRVWKLVRDLYESGKIRVKLTDLDGSTISGASLRNGKGEIMSGVS